MRKLIFSLVTVVCVTLSGDAQPRQAVLAPDGTLFSLETVATGEVTSAATHFVLRTQRDGVVAEEAVPSTVDNAHDTNAAIAYDAESGSVFVFWLRQLGTLSSQLMFTCRSGDGTWSTPEEFGSPFVYRENLRMAVTRRVSAADGTVFPKAAVSVHLSWWEFNTHDGSEAARYAMISIENGLVESRETLDLTPFVTQDLNTGEVAPDVLKQPLLFTAPTQESVVLVFGDVPTRTMNQVRIFPVRSEGRLRVPVGRHEQTSGAPRNLVAADSRVDGVYGTSQRMALYVRERDQIRYVVMTGGVWSDARTITLGEQITGSAAVEALRQLINEQ